MVRRSSRALVFGASCLLAVTGCTATRTTAEAPTSATASSTTAAGTDGREPSNTGRTSEPTTAGPTLTRPPWLGQRTLATDESGFGLPEPTPPELIDRRLPTTDTLPPPPDGEFVATIDAFEGEPLARSTWREGCPVEPDDLRYVTVSFWGFDGRPHTGELVVAEAWAEDLVGVFEVAWNERFPFEEMRIVTPADLLAPPTGDGNNTASFVCRAVTGGSRFSEHAKGLAIDINPFHNPYLRQELLLPELAGAYVEREDARDGMLVPGSPVVQAFLDIGWSWGGEWSSLKDWQHFSQNGL